MTDELKTAPRYVKADPAPRYDQIYEDGVKALNLDAGDDLDQQAETYILDKLDEALAEVERLRAALEIIGLNPNASIDDLVRSAETLRTEHQEVCASRSALAGKLIEAVDENIRIRLYGQKMHRRAQVAERDMRHARRALNIQNAANMYLSEEVERLRAELKSIRDADASSTRCIYCQATIEALKRALAEAASTIEREAVAWCDDGFAHTEWLRAEADRYRAMAAPDWAVQREIAP